MRKHVERINKVIELIFYAIFITTPLAMHPFTSELFEFNKMWLLFIYSLIIFFFWSTKMIIQKRFEIRRTPFDIPLLLFLSSQIISTFISIDPHTSFWGYYSRFNGGLLSTICYIFLYYAYATNILTSDREISLRKTYYMLTSIFVSAVIVALWGLPSHFGYDPTCLVFRGSFDVSCWTEAFQPKIRMFSTLGQPNWLATFLAIILPLTIAFVFIWIKKIRKNDLLSIPTLVFVGLLISTLIFYLDLGWTLSQSGFIGFWAGNFVFSLLIAVLIFKKNSFSIIKTFKQKTFILLVLVQIMFLLSTFFTVIPMPTLSKYTFSEIVATSQISDKSIAQPTVPVPKPVEFAQPALDAGITTSGDIRKIVWKGAIDIFKANPIFGSGVETFAYAYYKHRPVEHNLTSEWDYLYNKAHNEFLNYLATTGIYGLGTYLAFIFTFLFIAFRVIFRQFRNGVVGNPILLSFVGSFVVIQVSNFFGFSVVNVNLLMFFIPLFFFSLTSNETRWFVLPLNSKEDYVPSSISTGQIMGMIIFGIISIYNIFFLVNFWSADIDYALGSNYQRINEFALANPSLEKAVQKRGGEDLYNNELSVNLAAIAMSYADQKDQQNTALFASRAKELSDKVAQRNPNNIVFWKSRTRVMFSLAQLNQQVLNDAVIAIETAHKLAPTDAKITYNQALIYNQIGLQEKALASIEETIRLKPNYRDAYYAKALFLSGYIENDKKNPQVPEMKRQAIEALEFLLKNISLQDQQAIELLKTLK